MINNLLKVVGVNDNNAATTSSADFPTSSSSTAQYPSSYADSDYGNNLASTIGGLFSTIQETFQLDGKGVVSGAHLLVPGGGGVSSGVGIGFGRSGGGRSKNARSGRGYYTTEHRQREAAAAVGVPQLLSGMGTNAGTGLIDQRSRGKSIHETSSIIITNGLYQGRKIVSDINNLYDVVNDKEAHENYDTLMEIISNTTSAAAGDNNADDAERLSDCSGGSSHYDGGSSARRDLRQRGANSRGNSLERKLIWARLKEEEVVDRMLSQFPEFGTNLPTPYTVIDKDNNNDGDVEVHDNSNSFLRNSRKGGRGAKVSSGTANTSSTANKNSRALGVDYNDPTSPTARSFTDDASDIIGRFFFGMPSGGGDVPANSNVVGTSSIKNVEGRGGGSVITSGGGDKFQRMSSFGSASTLSTMTASASTLRAGAPVSGREINEKQRDGDGNNSAAAIEGIKIDTNSSDLGDKADVGYSSGWDQDEINLWMDKSEPRKNPVGGSAIPGARGGSKLQATALPEYNWASYRRLCRERHAKRHTVWNSLKSSHPGPPSRDTPPTPSIVSPLHRQQRLPQISLLAKKDDDQYEVSRQIDRASGGHRGAIFVDYEKQHWMPDNICKQCYSCEAPFTLIRRKHHCRLCGMIFCSVCSAYFVQISSEGDVAGGSNGIVPDGSGAQSTIRTCKLCYDHLTERSLCVVIRGQKLDYGNKSSLQQKFSFEHSAWPADASDASLTLVSSPIRQKDGKVNICTPSEVKTEIVQLSTTSITPTDLADQFAGFQGAEGVSLSGDFHALSIMKHRLEEERRKREECKRAELEVAARLSADEAKESERSNFEGGSFRLKSQLGSVRQLWNASLATNASNTIEDFGQNDLGVDNDALAQPLKVSDIVMGTENAAMPPLHHHLNTENITATTPRLETNFGNEEAMFESGGRTNAQTSAKTHLGTVAADYLEKITRELLLSDAPLLLEEIKSACTSTPSVEQKNIDMWVNTIMSLATRCCSVEPDVKKGDFLDIRPYCKVKVIPGGLFEDSAYLSGVVFRKNVSHKKMAKPIMNAKIMMLSGGIEYTRTENRIASLDTLLEQEERYMEILVSKLLKVAPNILIVGKSVCRKAQELLLRANIVLIQYVKPALMTRIARQTGATVISSIDHVNSTILGRCRRFRLVSFRDNDVWVDENVPSKVISSYQKSVPVVLSQDVPNHERQAALAAQKLGERVFDGMEAVNLGLAKRGVVQTYSMIEGCAKELGCTVILRGASRTALKMVKRVFRFLVNCSYNMKLETSYILERCCRLPPTYEIPPTPCCSSSLCVDFGNPHNRKARPWNGGKNDPSQRSLSGKITPLDHQAILITSVWMTEKTQCCPAEVKGICYYSMQDVSLGQFLRDSCFNLSLKCQNPSCKKTVVDHSLSFIHNDGMINISVERMDNPIPTSSLKQQQQKDTNSTADLKSETALDYEPIATWTYCTKCSQVVTPLIYLSKQTWQWSFGKFLEVYFYNRDAIINAPGHLCSCRMQTCSTLFFGCGNLAARFSYEKIAPYSVFCRRHLPFDESFHRAHALQDLEHISATSTALFLKYDKQIDAITRETRELFGSAMNKPEHLQAVLSELNLVSAEVDKASKVLQEKIATVTAKFSKGDSSKRTEYSESFLHNFPWYLRRYIFMLASAWNERLSAAGNALNTMKKIQNTGGSGRGDSAAAPVVGDASTDDVVEGMTRIRMLQDAYSRNYNVTKMTMPRSGEDGLFEGNILPDGRVAAWEEEADIDDEEFYSDPENDIDFEDDIDADVLASRNRAYSHHSQTLSRQSISRQHPKNLSSGKRLSDRSEESGQSPGPNTLGFTNNYDSGGQQDSQGKAKTVTAGGAVKSALNRLFNRGGNKEDPYVVDLGYFGKGRPRLQPGVAGLVVPVYDDQPSTIISHSLASAEYDVQFKHFLSVITQPETRSEKYESTRSDIERRMLGRNKSHIKHTFRDFDEKGQQLCKFVCTTFWSVQFDAVRLAFMNPQSSSKDTVGGEGSTRSSGLSKLDIERSYIRSLSTSLSWAASGGKSGAAFSRTTDDRFVIKSISRTELQMFLDCAPAYFEYLNKAFFHGLPTVLCKIVGVYQIGYHNRVTGRRTMEQVAVMQNIFYGRKISKIFDLKGSLRGRFTRFTRQTNLNKEIRLNKKSSQYRRSKSDATSDSDSFSSGDDDDDDTLSTSSGGLEKDDSDKGEKSDKGASIPTLLDGDFLEFTSGRPLPLTDRAKAVFHMSILNDTLFLSIINVLDYSILVGIDEEKKELVVGIIDFMRQYDILKQMERVGKSLPMVVGSEAPTIIQPPLYKARFTNAMERYFMTVPSKWTTV